MISRGKKIVLLVSVFVVGISAESFVKPKKNQSAAKMREETGEKCSKVARSISYTTKKGAKAQLALQDSLEGLVDGDKKSPLYVADKQKLAKVQAYCDKIEKLNEELASNLQGLSQVLQTNQVTESA